MAILSIAAMGVGYYAFRMNGQQKFYSSAARFVQNLQAAEEVMVMYSRELRLNVAQKNREVITELEFDEQLPPGFKRIFAERKIFDSIDSIVLLLPEGERREGSFTLNFNPTDFSTTRGIIELAFRGENRYILLTGYPGPLKLEKQPPKFEATSFSSEALYPREVLEQ